jgi:Ca2+-binding EF-hand superfamily protein
MTKRPPKKSDTLEVRMPHETKRAFLAACRKDGQTASNVVRTFVEGYLSRAALQDHMTPAWSIRRIWRSHAVRVGAIAAGAASVGALALVTLSTTPPAKILDRRGTFAFLDADDDGLLTVSEYARVPLPPEIRGSDMRIFVEASDPGDGDDPDGPLEMMSAIMLPAPEGSEGPEVTYVRRNEAGELVTEAGEALSLAAFESLRADVFAAVDADADGAVSFEEFDGYWRGQLIRRFQRLDRDHDGRLAREELATAPEVLEVTARGHEPVPIRWNMRAFEMLDDDRDGAVTFEEYASARI